MTQGKLKSVNKEKWAVLLSMRAFLDFEAYPAQIEVSDQSLPRRSSRVKREIKV